MYQMVDYSSFQLLRILRNSVGSNEGFVPSPTGISITRDGQRLISAGGGVKIWQIQTGVLLHKFQESPGALHEILLSTDETTLYCIGSSEIHVWNFPALTFRLKTGKSPDHKYLDELKARYGRPLDYDDIGLRHEGAILSVVEDPHRQKLYMGRSRTDRAHWDIRTSQWIKGGLRCSKIAMSRNTEILVGTNTGQFKVWQLSAEDPDFPKLLCWHKDSLERRFRSQSQCKYPAVHTLEVSNDGQVAYFGYINGDIELWSTNGFESIGLLQGHKATVTAMAVSPDGRVLASGSEIGSIKLWDLTTQAELLTLEVNHKWFFTLTFSPDGTLLASCGADRTIKLWGEPGTLG